MGFNGGKLACIAVGFVSLLWLLGNKVFIFSVLGCYQRILLDQALCCLHSPLARGVVMYARQGIVVKESGFCGGAVKHHPGFGPICIIEGIALAGTAQATA